MYSKVIVMIPCRNEESDLPAVIKSIPRNIDGLDITILLIDDGSTDNSVAIAKDLGVSNFVLNKKHLGLAKTFKKGLNRALQLGADIIVNIDADGQYKGEEIAKLIKPIISNQSDIVIGDRQIAKLDYLSLNMKILQKIGSAVVSVLSGVWIPDAPSGFRAFNRTAAVKLNVFGSYTYTLETIINSTAKGLKVISVPIEAVQTKRASCLVRSKSSYIFNSAITILRTFVIYNPIKSLFFLFFGCLLVFVVLMESFILGFVSDCNGLRSLTAVALFTFIIFMMLKLIIIADLLRCNRLVLEDIYENLREKES